MPTHSESASKVPESLHVFLVKTNARGQRQLWRADVENATVRVEWGQEGGAMQVKEASYEEGKQSRNAAQQAVFETLSLVKRKKRGGYAEDLQDVEMKEADEGDIPTPETVPLPMLAQEFSKHQRKATSTLWMQRKLDGIRCLAHVPSGTLWSRQRKQLVDLPHIEEAVRNCGAQVEWLDGEIYKHGMHFSEISSLARHTDRSAVLEYHVYDCISPLEFAERFQLLSQISTPSIVVVETMRCEPGEIEAVHRQFRDEDYEGSIIRLGGPYEHKRSMKLLKKKDFLQEEFVCVGFESQRRHPDKLGSIIMEKDGVRFGGNPKMNDKQKKEIWANQQRYIGQICTVEFDSYTTANNVPRFPRVVGFRHPDDM